MQMRTTAAMTILISGLCVGASSSPASAPDTAMQMQLEIGPGASIRGPVTLRRPDGSIALRIASEVTFGEPIEFH